MFVWLCRTYVVICWYIFCISVLAWCVTHLAKTSGSPCPLYTALNAANLPAFVGDGNGARTPFSKTSGWYLGHCSLVPHLLFSMAHVIFKLMNELQHTAMMLQRALVLHAHNIAVPIVLDVGCPAKFVTQSPNLPKDAQSLDCLLLVQSASQPTSQSISDSVRESESQWMSQKVS